jgi:TatA/E family protein of Tat protein translocase
MFNMGPTEIMMILLIALMVFGPKKLPEIGRSIGKSLRQLRSAQDDVKRELKQHLNADDDDGGKAPGWLAGSEAQSQAERETSDVGAAPSPEAGHAASNGQSTTD